MSDPHTPETSAPATQVMLKVIILQLVETFPDLTYDELLQLALGSMYMDYFTFCQLYPELEHAGLLRERSRKGERRLDVDGEPLKRMELTDEGRHTLEALSPHVPPAIHHFLEDAKRLQNQSLRPSREIEATYQPSPSQGYDVALGLIEEGHPIFRIQTQLPNEREARILVHRWQTQTEAMYTSIMRCLAVPRDEPDPDTPPSPDTPTE